MQRSHDKDKRLWDLLGAKRQSANIPYTLPGVSPMLWDKVIGQVAQKDYENDELI
ncbi:MAG: hypothetical protein H8E80_06665 [Desulfobacteraceae bacterium]|uniref:Uncharacterized protein n=1 Tax=Candidatus Desulfaltia bathyphila TaxID=2841697 RepID=A0A8J6TBY8_9BACT|nr:hypothetical protein [Candidatus Desulfaltia bathyphila]MBL7196278.1 hypothetical protein [Desulfobacterales bacterium]